MSETYVELLVKRETPLRDRLLNWLLLFLTVFSVILFMLTMNIFIVLFAAVFGVVYYIVHTRTNLEYEYLYVDKELTIDKVMNRSKRKNVRKISMERLEILAPVSSYHMADYKNRTGKIVDYSSGTASKNKYMMIYDGQNRILLEPNEALIKAIKNIAPRKVFTD